MNFSRFAGCCLILSIGLSACSNEKAGGTREDADRTGEEAGRTSEAHEWVMGRSTIESITTPPPARDPFGLGYTVAQAPPAVIAAEDALQKYWDPIREQVHEWELIGGDIEDEDRIRARNDERGYGYETEEKFQIRVACGRAFVIFRLALETAHENGDMTSSVYTALEKRMRRYITDVMPKTVHGAHNLPVEHWTVN